MKYLELSLSSPEANLACDEALLDWCEQGAGTPVLRVWESSRVFVVVGYSKPVASEVHVPTCGQKGIPILRRCTGGGTVVQGPGCLNYALVLRVSDAEAFQTIPGTNQLIMEKHRQALQKLLNDPVAVQGHTDLTVDGRKFSGNAQRRRREFLLFHGSFLVGFDLELVEQLLPMPAVKPEYRADRSHRAFLVNVRLSSSLLKETIRKIWAADEALSSWPERAIERLAAERYASREWNGKF